MLVGILIGLGRLAADGEITAMRAAGVSSRKVIAPVLLFAALGMGVAALATLRLTPYSIHKYTDIKNQLEATQLSADVTPRVFVENFPNTILYVGDVRPGSVAQHLRGRRRAAGETLERAARQGPGTDDYGGGGSHRGSGLQE